MARLFIAVRPPAAVLDAIDALPRPAEAGVRWVPRAQWHVTLRFLGEADPMEATAAFGTIDGPAVDVELGPRVSRLGRSVICVPVAGLDGLAALVASATRTVGSPPDPRPFRGHLTLARLKHRAACGLAGTPLRATFRCAQLELVQSRLSAAGAEHTVIARRDLG